MEKMKLINNNVTIMPTSKKATIGEMFDLLSLVIVAYAIYLSVNLQLNLNGFGGNFRFLTFINLLFLALYYTASLLENYVGFALIPKKLLDRDQLNAIGFTSSNIVMLLFWVIYFINPENFLDRKRIPPVLDFISHIGVGLIAWIELFVNPHTYKSFGKALLPMYGYFSLYVAWIYILKIINGSYPYPFMNFLTEKMLVVFIIGASCLGALILLIGVTVCNAVWLPRHSALKIGIKTQ